jgi:hypothetical protein
MKIACVKYIVTGLVTFRHASLSRYPSSCDHMFEGKIPLNFSSRTGSLNLLLVATYHTAYLYVHSVTLPFIICSRELNYLHRTHKWVL